jgi:hypothetical protein
LTDWKRLSFLVSAGWMIWDVCEVGSLFIC